MSYRGSHNRGGQGPGMGMPGGMAGGMSGPGGYYSPQPPQMPPVNQPRQLNLVAGEGISGNGVATIGNDNTFSVIAHLPPPHTLSPYPAVYAAYLADEKGKNGFHAGTLKAVGNGAYQARFRSPVPLTPYSKVLVSLEDPQSIAQYPQGPVILGVKESLLAAGGAAAIFTPMRKAGGYVWQKASGFIRSKIGGGKEQVQPEGVQYDQLQQHPPAQQAPAGQLQAPPQQYPQQSQGQYQQHPQQSQAQYQRPYQQSQGPRQYQGQDVPTFRFQNKFRPGAYNNPQQYSEESTQTPPNVPAPEVPQNIVEEPQAEALKESSIGKTEE